MMPFSGESQSFRGRSIPVPIPLSHIQQALRWDRTGNPGERSRLLAALAVVRTMSSFLQLQILLTIFLYSYSVLIFITPTNQDIFKAV